MMTMLLIVLGLAAVVLLARAQVLSANAHYKQAASQSFADYEVEGGAHIYKGAVLGRHVATGYVRPFQVCDEAVGIAYEEVDNTLGADGAVTVRTHVHGDFLLTVSGATQASLGKAVYATADDAVSLSGHALGFLGRIVGLESAGVALVRLKQPGELPTHADHVPMCLGGPWTRSTGDNGGSTVYVDGDGVQIASALGLGVIPYRDGVQLSLDNTDEASHAGLVTPAKFAPLGGIVGRIKLAAYATSGNAMTGANVDLDFGIADAVVRTAVDPTYHVRCHVDGAGTTLALGGDDNATDVAEADTTLELPKTRATAVEYIFILRPVGATVVVEVYADGVLIATPDLGQLDFAAASDLSVFVNVEKSSAAGIAIVEVVEFQAFGARV